jgi:hypothetical protein
MSTCVAPITEIRWPFTPSSRGEGLVLAGPCPRWGTRRLRGREGVGHADRAEVEAVVVGHRHDIDPGGAEASNAAVART